MTHLDRLNRQLEEMINILIKLGAMNAANTQLILQGQSLKYLEEHFMELLRTTNE